jgi:hypothetical protein
MALSSACGLAGQLTKGRRQKAEGRMKERELVFFLHSAFCLHPSAFFSLAR